jgi:hypothetical protein
MIVLLSCAPRADVDMATASPDFGEVGRPLDADHGTSARVFTTTLAAGDDAAISWVDGAA